MEPRFNEEDAALGALVLKAVWRLRPQRGSVLVYQEERGDYRVSLRLQRRGTQAINVGSSLSLRDALSKALGRLMEDL
jgi:hypothetical protein